MLRVINPRGMNQERIFEAFDDEKNLFIHGYAGTGKTFTAMYLALDAVLNHKDFDKVVIVRSCVPARSQGFLPGNENEKNEIFEVPYDAIVPKLFDKVTYKQLKNQGTIEFMSTSYLRGQTIERAVIIADEIQNFNQGEIDTTITRTGKNCQLILIGDTAQNDLQYLREESCVHRLPRIISKMKSFETIEMGIDDIQRNTLVKEWILAKEAVIEEGGI